MAFTSGTEMAFANTHASTMRGGIGPLAANFEMLSIPDCGHFPPEERLAELAAALRDHFARCP